MALPLVPAALIGLRYAACLGLVLALARRRLRERQDDIAETAMDAADDGLRVSREGDRVRAAGKWRWRMKTAAHRPDIEVEAAFLGRLRLRRV